MLLFVVLINDRSFLLSSQRKHIFISSLSSNKQLFFVSGRISPQVLRCFNKPTTSLFVWLLVFQQLRSTLPLKMPLQALLWQKLAFSSPFCYSNDLSSILFSGGIVMLLSSLIFSNCGSCSFHAYPFNRSVLPFSFKFFFILSSLASLSNRSAVRF